MAEPTRGVSRRLTDEEPTPLGSFKLQNITVNLFERPKGGVYLELNHTAPFPDGRTRTQHFVCTMDRFRQIYSRA